VTAATTTRLANAGHAYDLAKQQERRAMAALYKMIVRAYEEGVPEATITRLAGVDRMTVRRALGKRP
jgi:DNA invertase Pin-like site-specific DNA recombinase